MTKPKVFLRAPHGYDVDEASDESAFFDDTPSMTKQSFKEECDINTIVERFGQGYQMPEGVVAPTYGDFSGVFDFGSAMNAIAVANEAFDALPASVRSRFQNDPALFVDFCSTEGNGPELEKLGLLPPRPPGAVAAASGTPPPAAAPAAAPEAPPKAP